MDNGTFWGRRPEIGDNIYVDFGDSVIDGGEIFGRVVDIDSDGYIYLHDNFSFHPDEAVHIEVMED